MSTDETGTFARPLPTNVPFAKGVVVGIGAWMLGYLITYVWKAEAVSESLRGIGLLSELLGGEAVPAWKGVAWLFLNAHFVDLTVPTFAGGTRMFNVVTAEGGPLALVVVPALVLVAAGTLVAAGGRGDLRDRVTAGATVALGYLPVSVAAGLATAHSIGNTDATIAPDPVTAILLAGVVYPVVLGLLGGMASSALE